MFVWNFCISSGGLLTSTYFFLVRDSQSTTPAPSPVEQKGISTMIIPLIFALISLIATTTPAVQAQNDIDFLSDEFGFSMLQQRLPKPISDHTATLDVSTGLTYLAGGCDSPNGNVRMDSGYYSCSSISNQLYRFDQATKQFQTLAPLPAPRYRHAAAFVNNQLWLMGGRDAQDTLLPTVDVRYYRIVFGDSKNDPF